MCRVKIVLTRRLGASGPEVSVVGLGTNNFGWRIGLEESRAVIDAALDEGITLLDTADVYGATESETILGEVLEGRRRPLRRADEVRAPGSRQPRGRATHVARLYPLGHRRLARAAAHRRDRHLHAAQAGRRDADRRDRRGARRARAGGQGALRRALERRCRPDRRGGRGCEGARGAARLRREPLQPDPPRGGGGRDPGLRAPRLRPAPLLPARERPPDREVPPGEAPPADSRFVGNATVWPAERWLTDEAFDAVEALEAFAGERGVPLLDLALGGLAAMPGVGSVIAGATTPAQVRANARAGQWQPSADDLAALRSAPEPQARPATRRTRR